VIGIVKRSRVVVVVLVGGLLLVCLLIVAGGPLLQQMGIQPFCVEGDWPDIRFVRCPETAAAAPLPQPTPDPAGPIPLIFDDDGSPDGLIALLYFLNHPGYEVRAVTVSPGEAHPAVFAPKLSHWLAGLGRIDIPVGAGRDSPLAGGNAFPDPWRQASDDFWGLELPETAEALRPVPAAQLIVDTLNQSDRPVTIFVSGTHTNLAEALRLHPAAAGKIAAVYIMGGSLHVPGNIGSDWPEIDNDVAEWNIWVDPLAAQEVFATGLELHLVPLDATDQVTWTAADTRAWAGGSLPEGDRAADILNGLFESWSTDSVIIWDLVAAIQASDPAFCSEQPYAVAVVVDPGPEQGRTVVAAGRSPNTTVCLEPDPELVRARAASILGR
jgi:pyrimidine-specific ribonucleoside hydrolase